MQQQDKLCIFNNRFSFATHQYFVVYFLSKTPKCRLRTEKIYVKRSSTATATATRQKVFIYFYFYFVFRVVIDGVCSEKQQLYCGTYSMEEDILCSVLYGGSSIFTCKPAVMASWHPVTIVFSFDCFSCHLA